MSVLEKIISSMSNQEQSVVITLKKTSNDTGSILITPKIGVISDNATDEEISVMTALSVPLRITGKIGDLESSLLERLDSFQKARTPVFTELDAIVAARSKTQHKTETNQSQEPNDLKTKEEPITANSLFDDADDEL